MRAKTANTAPSFVEFVVIVSLMMSMTAVSLATEWVGGYDG